MNQSQKHISLDLAKRMAEEGFPQGVSQYIYGDYNVLVDRDFVDDLKTRDNFDAYDVPELGEMIKERASCFWHKLFGKYRWVCNSMKPVMTIYRDTMVEAMGEMALYLVKKGLINLSDIKVMKKIKFRAWDKINKRLVNTMSLQIQMDGSISGVWELIDGEDELYGMHQIVLMQSTGLQDKNGKEIWEGDIIKSFRGKIDEGMPIISEVIFDKYSAQFCLKGFEGRSLDWYESHEIIGNIYENPHLLK